MTSALFRDLLAFGVVFLLAWILYFAAHVAAAAVGLIRGVDRSTVVLAVVMALVAGLISWFWLPACFSSPAVHGLASITAPIAFLGYCGIYVLIGPVTVDRSISLSMLRALEASQHKRLVRSQLQGEVPFDRIFQKRIRELEQSGSIEVTKELTVTPRGRRILGLYIRLAKVLKVDFQ